MRNRDQSCRFAHPGVDFAVNAPRGQRSRGFALSRARAIAGAVLLGALSLATIASAAYLAFRDDLLASLLDRQTQMQYAYEDRLAALRLRLDQVAGRRLVDQDGVEGKVQNLVLRQAQLETRAAVMAQLLEGAIARDPDLTLISQTRNDAVRRNAPGAGKVAKGAGGAIPEAVAGAAAIVAPRPDQGAFDDSVMTSAGKPEPEGMDLRLGREPEGRPAPLAPPSTPPQRGQRTPIDMSQAPAPAASLALAGDPELPIAARLENLERSIDRIERDQSRRLSGIVKPALEAAKRLKRAFDIAGLPIGRFLSRSNRRDKVSVGGPFIPAQRAEDPFEREFVAAQSAVAALDGLRRALPMTPLRKPLSGDLRLTSTFGYRTDPFFGRPALHSGVDLRDDYGAPVRATAGGLVAVAGPNGGYGNLVEVDHGDGLSTRYAHLSAISVVPGQRLAPGAIVGRVGSTGRSTGPHLHYEVRLDGESVDPARFLNAASALAQ